ncbi:MAG: EAL domain-containing protein [Candidatus Dormibacteria bacterium]
MAAPERDQNRLTSRAEPGGLEPGAAPGAEAAARVLIACIMGLVLVLGPPTAAGAPLTHSTIVLLFVVNTIFSWVLLAARLPRWTELIPAVTWLGLLTILVASSGPAGLVYAPLASLSVTGIAIYQRSRYLAVGLLLSGLIFMVPALEGGADPRVAALAGLYFLLLCSVAMAMRELVRRGANQRASLEAVTRLARTLGSDVDAQDARRAICHALLEVTDASGAVLFELSGSNLLVPTATGGTPLPPVHLSLSGEAFTPEGVSLGYGPRPYSAVEAFVTRRPVLRSEMKALPRFMRQLAENSSSVSNLCQPVIRDDKCVAVLTLTWRRRVRTLSDPAASAVALMAEEAAVSLRQVDLADQLRRMARMDALTEVANRRAWEEELPRAMASASRSGRPMCVALIDLDGFKTYNDDWGHQRGDRLLRDCATAWRGQLRDLDFLARYGGDEFALILPACDEGSARAILKRIRSATPAGQGCSAGVAQWDGGESAGELLARADAALYDRKRGDRNDDEPGPAERGSEESPRWSKVVSEVLEKQAVATVYQPILRLSDRDVFGYEALARPLGGAATMSVEGMFAAAQRIGAARDLDWLCRRAALDGARSIAAGTPLFINVGVWALLDPVHDVDQMLLLLRWAGRTPTDVVLEISEREIAADLGRLRQVLADYRSEGFRFAMDDVGEGHSTLEVLASANPEFIKLAGRLTARSHEPGPRAAIRALVEFGRSNGADVIAEVIAHESHAAPMLELGVTLGQGFGLAPPTRLTPDTGAIVWEPARP